MEDDLNLDLEFKRYIQILQPHLTQLINHDVISICNAWIRRLSECNISEKNLRNKYVFALCYQLAKGQLEEPFTEYPTSGDLAPFNESINSEDTLSETEHLIVNADDVLCTRVIYDNNKTVSDSDVLSQLNEYAIENNQFDDSKSIGPKKVNPKETLTCYTCPEVMQNQNYYAEGYETRAKNLIQKLREIKNENILLHNELEALKEESSSRWEMSDRIIKVDNCTSCVKNNESTSTIKSLKCKLQEVQDSRNDLIDKIASLQEQIDIIREFKNTDIENLEAKYRLEIINLKTTIKDDLKQTYENKIEKFKTTYEDKIKVINQELIDLKISKDMAIEERNNVIMAKDKEIQLLKNQIEDLKNHLHSVIQKYIDKPNVSSNNDTNKLKAEQLERRLNKMEKNKMKSTRIYESKLAQMQRDKHLAECSLQLQMVRQRTQVVNEVTDENQAELATALDKLETKYKEIVANVQATAIQRRMQDQIALESILQAACGIPNENNLTAHQFPKTIRNQTRNIDTEASPLLHCNKVGNVGNKSFGEDSLPTGYCLNGERMSELFERVYIPQRDNTDTK